MSSTRRFIVVTLTVCGVVLLGLSFYGFCLQRESNQRALDDLEDIQRIQRLRGEIAALQQQEVALAEEQKLADAWIAYCSAHNVLQRIYDQDHNLWPYNDAKMRAYWNKVGKPQLSQEKQ